MLRNDVDTLLLRLLLLFLRHCLVTPIAQREQQLRRSELRIGLARQLLQIRTGGVKPGPVSKSYERAHQRERAACEQRDSSPKIIHIHEKEEQNRELGVHVLKRHRCVQQNQERGVPVRSIVICVRKEVDCMNIPLIAEVSTQRAHRSA